MVVVYQDLIAIRTGTLLSILWIEQFNVQPPDALRARLSSVLAKRMGSPSTPSTATTGTTTPAPTGAGATTCRALVDTDLDKKLATVANKPLKIPAKNIKFLTNLAGQVVVTYYPGQASACKNHLTSFVSSPGIYADGQLSLGAVGSDGSHYGPFIYSAPQTAWLSTPGAPVRDPVAIQFSSAKVDSSVGLHLNASFQDGKLSRSLDLADIQLHAISTEVTLVSHRDSLFQVALGPTIALQAQISRADAENAVKKLESQGLDAQTAEVDAAEELAGDSSVAAEQVASEFYAVEIRPAIRVLAVQLDDQLFLALRADPVLAASASPLSGFPEDPAVPADPWISEPIAGEVHAEVGAATAEVDGAGALFEFFFPL